jgi:4-amino-4-deoxychorismate lyase
MSLLVETIKIKDGVAVNLPYHERRLNRTRRELFGASPDIDLSQTLLIPAFAGRGLFKCRIEYNDHIRNIEFNPYKYRTIRTLRMVEAGDLDYSYKWVDRSGIEKLLEQKAECDDILMVKNGRVTDASYANIVVRGADNRWYTPSEPLLRGTMREWLLDKGMITEREITPASLKRFRELRLINTMMDIEESESIAVRAICF